MPTPTKGPRLGGGPSHEKLLIGNLARALFSEGRIRTTEAKAKRLRPQAERLITFAKRGDVASRRQVLTVVRDKAVVHKLFAEIAPRFADRQGGYTRILKLGPRPGDAAPMVVIELVEQADAGEKAPSGAEGGGRRRRRFGRGRAGAEAAPEGANRAERRAALRRRGTPAEAEAATAALAGEELDEDLDELDQERPSVPTDAEVEAGAAPAVVDDDGPAADDGPAGDAAAEVAEDELEVAEDELEVADDGPAGDAAAEVAEDEPEVTEDELEVADEGLAGDATDEPEADQDRK